MMKSKKGFTLLELLVAAAIIGMLAVFATISYRSSQIETEMAHAKGRTRVLAGAVQRFRLEYPRPEHFSGIVLDRSAVSNACQPNNANLDQLFNCQLLENGGWTSEFVEYYVCNGKTGDCGTSPINDPLACMKGKDHPRMPDQYRTSEGFIYCVSATDARDNNLGR